MSSPGTDDAAIRDRDGSPVPDQRPPQHASDDPITQIMPVIAPWPEPDQEPPTPPQPEIPPAVETVHSEPVPVPDQPSAPASEDAADPPRTGPIVLDADAWDEPVPPVPLGNGPPRGPGASRLRLMVGLVLLALAAAVAILFALSSGQSEPPVATRSPTAADEPPQISAVLSEPARPAAVATVSPPAPHRPRPARRARSSLPR